jgi:glycerol-3-phosphate dehydrogenase
MDHRVESFHGVGETGMNRDESLRQVADPKKVWDVLIIGGGATGLGAAVEAVSRGYSTLLLEQCDFAKATSSRSTKLVHGGVRYLAQGDITLVLHALRERGLLAQNAPHLARTLPFIIPVYHWWDAPFYGIGLKVYDALSGKLSLGHSHVLGRAKTLKLLSTVQPKGLMGGVLYTDGQFDDARLATTLALTFSDLGGTALNYARVKGLLKQNDKVSGAVVEDLESGRTLEIHARTVLNATGIFTDTVRRFDDPGAKNMLSVSQGAHIVLDRSFLPGDTALMVPKTEDGRVLFAIPWHQHVVVGTTDIPVPKSELEPRALDEEVEFLLRHASLYLARPVSRQDVLSVFAGQRPLVTPGHGEKTSKISRDHTVVTSKTNLVTITGGKWTTYRRMGQDAIDHIAQVGNLPPQPSRTENLRLHGYLENAGEQPHRVYGSDYPKILELAKEDSSFGQLLHKRLPYLAAEVVWAARYEMARTVEDVLSRRTRALFLDARASAEAAPETARLLARELGRDETWARDQVTQFQNLAAGYSLN